MTFLMVWCGLCGRCKKPFRPAYVFSNVSTSTPGVWYLGSCLTWQSYSLGHIETVILQKSTLFISVTGAKCCGSIIQGDWFQHCGALKERGHSKGKWLMHFPCCNNCYRMSPPVYVIQRQKVLSVCQYDVKCHCHLWRVPVKSGKGITCVDIPLILRPKARDVVCGPMARSWAQYGKGFHLPAVGHCPICKEAG